MVGSVKDYPRGFARTIPSFLIAYGDDGATPEEFDIIITDKAFLNVTSITLANIRLLRDGRDYENPDTGERNILTDIFLNRLFSMIP